MALFWTGLILFLCLKNANELSLITIVNFDKVIHSVFHLILTLLWFLYLRQRFIDKRKNTLMWYSFLFSFVFGIFVEVLQELFTTTRQADVFDIIANLAGSIVASLAVGIVKFNDISNEQNNS
jgi:VanZ family protein